MESTPAKPVKKRRRWLIVAFVLVLVSLVSWWHWPRGDAMFTGTWAISEAGKSRVHGYAVFSRNGSGLYRTLRPDAGGRSIPWRVQGGRFIWGTGPVGALSPVFHSINEWFRDFTGDAAFDPAEAFD